MHISQKAFEAVRKVQKENQYKKVEHLDIFDEKGSELKRYSGDKSWLEIPKEDLTEFEPKGNNAKAGIIATHNHPSKLRVSPVDIRMAFYTNLKEIQSTTLDGKVHIMELHRKINVRDFLNYEQGIYSKYLDELKQLRKKFAEDSEEFYRATVPIARKYQKLIAKQFGVKFRTVLLK